MNVTCSPANGTTESSQFLERTVMVSASAEPAEIHLDTGCVSDHNEEAVILIVKCGRVDGSEKSFQHIGKSSYG